MKRVNSFLRLIFLATYFFSVANVSGQISLNTTGNPPDSSAAVDIHFANKGILIPRVSLTSTSDSTTIPSPATSLLVYNTGTGGLTRKGYWYNSGTPAAPVWVLLHNGGNPGTAWDVLGNAGTSADTNFLGTTDAQDLVFRTNNTEKMRILSNGRVGIGTTAPMEKLDVVGNIMLGPQPSRITFKTTGNDVGIIEHFEYTSDHGHLRICIGDNGNPEDNIAFGYYLHTNGSWQERMRIRMDGRVGIGTTSPTMHLSVNGNANKVGGGSWAVFSDERLKKDIKPFTDGLSIIENINPVTFQYNGKGGISTKEEYIGVVAQEVQKIAPYMVSVIPMKLDTSDAAPTDILQFDPNALWYLTINAIKTLKAENDALKKDNAQLKSDNALLKSDVQTVQRRLKHIEELLGTEAKGNKKTPDLGTKNSVLSKNRAFYVVSY